MEQSQTRNKVIQTLGILLPLLLFYAALWVLRREVRASHYQDILQYLKQIPYRSFLLAFLFSMGSYLALTFYDFLGLKHIRKKLSYARTALTSFIAYSFSHNIGASLLTGGSVRYRLYSAWGLSVGETANVLLVCGMTFWIGFLTMGAVFFFLQPPDLPPTIHLPFNSVFSAGVFCLAVIALYLLSCVLFKKTIRIWKWSFPTPSLGIALGQMAAGCLDWTCSGTALFLLLPHSSVSFPSFMAIYLLAQLVGFASQVPGGLGVLETIIVVLLSPVLHAADVLGALLAFRMVYYLIPFVLGLGLFSGNEIIRNKQGFKRALQILNRWAPDFAPHVFSVLLFLCGALVLYSNASPEAPRQMAWLSEYLPLPFLESSHLLVGLVGALLMVAARGLQQRLEGAHTLSLILLGAGLLGCLFKGFDYTEALVLLILFALLLPTRAYFPRKSSLIQQRYPPLWVAAVLFVWLGCIWVGVFNYRYIEDYSNDLWTTFALDEDAARFLRSNLATAMTLLIFSIVTLLSPSQPETEFPSPSDLSKVLEPIGKSRRSYPHLALLGDKALLFNKKGDAFVMYAIEGKCWTALGDPVGGTKEGEELAQKFRDLCRRKKAWALFYLVDKDHFQFYLDLGMTVQKIGEEARVSLDKFKAETTLPSELREIRQRLKGNEDYSFEVLEPGAKGIPWEELKAASESWLSRNKTREKGFSMGFFHPVYLEKFPLALLREEGRVAAFANLLPASGREELAVDLLRSATEQGPVFEDYLLTETMIWAKEKGYHWFNLGTASLLDLEESPLAPFKAQMLGMFSPHVEGPNMGDIRKGMGCFSPAWVPKYLATSSNLALSVAFANIHSLIARGNRIGLKK